MNYPVWELAMGGGLLIAIVSVLHVFVSHFAIGGGLWLALTESRARRHGDAELLAFVRSHSKFFILVTLVFGAISGVGIWFTIGLVSPASVSALIHGFVWGWAMEWVFFFVEIAAALIYFYGWDRLDARTHQIVGWIYFLAAWASLFVINGIITFMLTPGGWLDNHDFWTGFFNPTFWPSLVVRTFASFGMAGLFTLLTAASLPRTDFRYRVTRYCALWVVVAVIGASLGGIWYRSVFPAWSDLVMGAVPILPIMVNWLQIGLVAVLVLALWPLLIPRSWHPVGVALLLISGLSLFATGEWIREAGRKPFTIKGYIYSTGMLVADEETVAADGVLAHTRWIDPATTPLLSQGQELPSGPDRDVSEPTVALGQQIYRAHCQPCHTMDGYNGLRRYLAHWNEETIASLLPRLQYMRAMMPPWYGDEFENAALTSYLSYEGTRSDATLPLRQEKAQRVVWDVSCGLCHTVDGYRPLRESLEGYTTEELAELLDSIGDLTDEMPAYFGEEQQRELLLEYLAHIAGAEGTVEVVERSEP